MVHFKKLVRNAAAVLLTLSIVTSAASAASFGTGTVTGKSLRLRSGASSSTSTLDIVPRGTLVDVLEDIQGGWYKVSVNGFEGYMSAEYLDVIPFDVEEAGAPAPALEDGDDLSQDEAEQDESSAELFGRVNTSKLNVRSGAGTDYDRIAQISNGMVVTILENLGGWYKISFGSVIGYASAEYLTLVDASALAAASSKGAQLVETAKQYLGVRYRYGGTSPSGFDCSGFVYYLMKSMGSPVPRTASSQWSAGYTRVEKSDLQPGDLVFFSNTMRSSNYITHVGIYVGNGQFIHSSSPSSGGVIYSSLTEGYYGARYAGACRVFA